MSSVTLCDCSIAINHGKRERASSPAAPPSQPSQPSQLMQRMTLHPSTVPHWLPSPYPGFRITLRSTFSNNLKSAFVCEIACANSSSTRMKTVVEDIGYPFLLYRAFPRSSPTPHPPLVSKVYYRQLLSACIVRMLQAMPYLWCGDVGGTSGCEAPPPSTFSLRAPRNRNTALIRNVCRVAFDTCGE